MKVNREDIYDGITEVRENLVQEAAPKKKRNRAWYFAPIAAVLALALCLGIYLGAGKPAATPGPEVLPPPVLTVYAMSEARYPEMPPYPKDEDYVDENWNVDSASYDRDWAAWRTALQKRQDAFPQDTEKLNPFFRESSREFLTGGATENRVYSPLNLYMALGMLAEATGGDTREEILSLLGADSLEALEAQAKGLWEATCGDDGRSTTLLASSLWLSQDISYVQDTMDSLAENYYASSYRGEMGSQEFDQALQDWINGQTGGLLQEQAQGLHMDVNTILALATTVYFKAGWNTEFMVQNTTPDTFHGPSRDVETDFMHRSDSMSYYWGERFSAVNQEFRDGGKMWFFLPDEGTDVEALLEDEEAMALLLGGERENRKYLTVNLSLPKFDVSSKLDLEDGLKKLGISKVFDDMTADFTPTTKDVKGVYLSQAEQAARVTIDEEGCEAAAYTVFMAEAGGAEPPAEEVDFTLDRPFLFAITTPQGLPLFLGIVNQPN